MENMKSRFYDIQVNGYAGVDFNQNSLSVENLSNACLKLEKDCVDGIFATIITTDLSDMILRIKQLVKLREHAPIISKIIKGIHIEGPFLNSSIGFRGAHPKEYILKPDLETLKKLEDAADGLLSIFTLAPEMDKNNILIKYLSSRGITVSAGHCNPRLDELMSAIDAGLSMFTHLGNGCPQEMHRHDNIIQRVLSLKNNLWICFIADGIHIPFYVLKNYIKIAGVENCIITSDAMAAAGAKAGRYTISNIELEVGEDRVVREPGKDNFAGSAIDMKLSYKNLIEKIGLTVEESRQLTYSNPLKVFNKL